jgi:hypothetical protein
MLIKNKKNVLYYFIALAFAMLCFNIILFLINSEVRVGGYLNQNRREAKEIYHIKKPQEVKGIYITAYSAGTNRLDELIDFIKQQGFNTAVVDVKGPKGEPAFALKNKSLLKYNIGRPLYSVEEVIKKLHKAKIYAIARVFVFQDPFLVEREPQFALHKKSGGMWADYKGVRWLDPTHFGVWKYNADMMREVYDRGFDEVQFDYIRFPSDGNLETIKYSGWDGKTAKEVEIEKFFIYLSRVASGAKIPISADLFGLVCCMENYDLGIGQVLERALPYFGFISPMMYPSHYSNGFQGFKNPASYPYEVVKYSMDKANEKTARLAASSTVQLAKLRPWIQDFDIGDNYDAAKVNAQIRATEETGADGFLIWNARNVYTGLTQ